MAIYFGNDKIKEIYHGSDKIKELWYGGELVWKYDPRVYLYNRGIVYSELVLQKSPGATSILEYRNDHIYAFLARRAPAVFDHTITTLTEVNWNDYSAFGVEMSGVMDTANIVEVGSAAHREGASMAYYINIVQSDLNAGTIESNNREVNNKFFKIFMRSYNAQTVLDIKIYSIFLIPK